MNNQFFRGQLRPNSFGLEKIFKTRVWLKEDFAVAPQFSKDSKKIVATTRSPPASVSFLVCPAKLAKPVGAYHRPRPVSREEDSAHLHPLSTAIEVCKLHRVVVILKLVIEALFVRGEIETGWD